jgi:hypothetical protein
MNIGVIEEKVMNDNLIKELRKAACQLPGDYVEISVLIEKAADVLEDRELVIKGYRNLALNILGVE